MKICTKHWEQVIQGVKDRGLWHLVSPDGQTAIDRQVAELTGTAVKSDYDPLMAANHNFWSWGMQNLGMLAMQVDPVAHPENDGHICPLCEARASFDAHNTPTGRCGQDLCHIVIEPGSRPWDEHAIEGCLNAILEYCQQENLTAPKQ